MMKPTKPSSMPNPLPGQKRSTTLWTTPEPADVISYAYLWHREAVVGQEEGLKDRPVVVVVAQQIVSGRTQLFVVPVTHSQPAQGSHAIEMPQSVKRHLGLDADRSWMIVSELNSFLWSGPDVRPALHGATGSPLYGPIPEWLFERVKAAVLDRSNRGKLLTTRRTE